MVQESFLDPFRGGGAGEDVGAAAVETVEAAPTAWARLAACIASGMPFPGEAETTSRLLYELLPVTFRSEAGRRTAADLGVGPALLPGHQGRTGLGTLVNSCVITAWVRHRRAGTPRPVLTHVVLPVLGAASVGAAASSLPCAKRGRRRGGRTTRFRKWSSNE
ncbi:hypothetical protein KBY55_04170 [Streptomyces sp. b94]|uniref:hypothetical protein n=1 Tax=Streptomyces sp. b94 TaxID=1827634 RepID=UPI001B35B7EF|nr:hypothetical protein [Streptomyces sp. b94]MBQ1095314.1 hypothetical protein [Streptomyces sp. b94]